MKKIIVCCDGTWNKPGVLDHGTAVATNVEKIWNSIFCDGQTQVKKYIKGVGTKNWRNKIVGGLTGKGLDENIIEAYTFVVNNYVPGDELYFFGFSRGAYTARSLVGLIRNSGIVINSKDISNAFKLYRNRSQATHPNLAEAVSFRRKFSHSYNYEEYSNESLPENDLEGAITGDNYADIDRNLLRADHVIRVRFLGIWDTVGTLGIPLNRFQLLTKKKYCFHDVTLTSTVDYAYHAIAIDECRKIFAPTIWERSSTKIYGTNKYVQQMWFPGVHSNIGGGYVDIGLSDIALDWICNKLKKIGLQFSYNPTIAPDYNGVLYNSRTGVHRLSGVYLRKITLKDGVTITQIPITLNRIYNMSFHEFIHSSVEERLFGHGYLFHPNFLPMRKKLKGYNIRLSKPYTPLNVYSAMNSISTMQERRKLFVD